MEPTGLIMRAILFPIPDSQNLQNRLGVMHIAATRDTCQNFMNI